LESVDAHVGGIVRLSGGAAFINPSVGLSIAAVSDSRSSAEAASQVRAAAASGFGGGGGGGTETGGDDGNDAELASEARRALHFRNIVKASEEARKFGQLLMSKYRKDHYNAVLVMFGDNEVRDGGVFVFLFLFVALLCGVCPS
jgi:hypothetical protein